MVGNDEPIEMKYELNNAHVCHANVCFKIPSVLVKNMTDKVILVNGERERERERNTYTFFRFRNKYGIL